MDNNWSVYMHINKQSGKRYIGVTSVDPKQRWGHLGLGYKNQMFYRAI